MDFLRLCLSNLSNNKYYIYLWTIKNQYISSIKLTESTVGYIFFFVIFGHFKRRRIIIFFILILCYVACNATIIYKFVFNSRKWTYIKKYTPKKNSIKMFLLFVPKLASKWTTCRCPTRKCNNFVHNCDSFVWNRVIFVCGFSLCIFHTYTVVRRKGCRMDEKCRRRESKEIKRLCCLLYWFISVWLCSLSFFCFVCLIHLKETYRLW